MLCTLASPSKARAKRPHTIGQKVRMNIVPKNWRNFQHYKDRNPPWIRLHKGLLDDLEFHQLSPYASKLLVLMWLMASESVDGVIVCNADRIAFRLRLEKDAVSSAIDEILRAGFFVDAGSDVPDGNDGKPLAQKMREKNGFGSRHISDKVKRAVWERDGGLCRSCRAATDIEFDHITPVSKGGDGSEQNIQLLCRPCNRKKRANVLEQAATPAQPWLELRTSETEAETLQRTEAETEKKPRKARRQPDGCLSVDDLIAEGVDPQVAKDWLQVRKDKGAKTLTQTAWDGVKAEAIKAGLSPGEAVKESAERSWQGFKASWLAQQQARGVPVNGGKHTGFDSKDYSAGALEDGTIV